MRRRRTRVRANKQLRRAKEHASTGTAVRRRRVKERVHASQAARDGTGQQPRSGKMAGTRMQHAMVGACHSVRARRDAPATPDCLMARMVPSKP